MHHLSLLLSQLALLAKPGGKTSAPLKIQKALLGEALLWFQFLQ